MNFSPFLCQCHSSSPFVGFIISLIPPSFLLLDAGRRLLGSDLGHAHCSTRVPRLDTLRFPPHMTSHTSVSGLVS